MSTYKDDLIDKHRTPKGIVNLVEYEAAFSEACAEVDRLRLALAASRDEAEKAKARIDRVMQTKRGIGGNCLAACLASIFKVPLESIPDLAPKESWDGNGVQGVAKSEM